MKSEPENAGASTTPGSLRAMDGSSAVRCGAMEVLISNDRVMGLVLWPAARPVARWLASFGASCQQNLLELGCGAGLCGLALSKAREGAGGAGVSVLTDYDDRVMDVARKNVELNSLDRVHVRPLDMGIGLQEEGQELLQEFGPFQVVVGSDIIPEPGQIARVLNAAGMLLDESGRLLLGVSSNFENFVASITAQGEAVGFTLESQHRCTDGTSLLAFVRGSPNWSLPRYTDVAEPWEQEAVERRGDSGPDAPGEDRADLLFA